MKRVTFAAVVVLGIGATCCAGPSDDECVTETATFQGGGGPIKGYLARPKGDGPFPAIIVIHEWWGLSDWVKGNAEALAKQGYAALAVDLYGGKVTKDASEAHELMRALNQSEAVANLKGGAAYLKGQQYVDKTKKLGVIGWCMGGGLSRELAQASDVVGPTVICYGSVTTDAAQAAKLKTKPVLGIFAADDRGIKAADAETFGSLIKNAGGKADIHVYPKAGHGFMRPGGPQYAEKAAADAWEQINGFFRKNLRQ